MFDSFVTPWTAARQAPLSMGFPKQEHWNGLPFLFPGHLPDPGIKSRSPVPLASAGGFSEPTGKPIKGQALFALFAHELRIPVKLLTSYCCHLVLHRFTSCSFLYGKVIFPAEFQMLERRREREHPLSKQIDKINFGLGRHGQLPPINL